MRTLVTGAGGFIGGHLVARLLSEGHEVRAVDIKPINDWWQWHRDFKVENVPNYDLRLRAQCMRACEGVGHVYNLAADMGGIGFIERHKTACMLSVLINTHMLMASEFHGVQRYFYSSSACVYAADKQNRSRLPGLCEGDAYPATPEDGYGWEKLFSERMCRHFMEERGLECRVARFHNIYGPHGSWNDGREKAPAALCRKVAEAKLSGGRKIEIWGNGKFTRSFCYIEDCLEGIRRIMDSDVREPINLGSAELVTIDRLAETIQQVAGLEHRLAPDYKFDEPQGVQGRNSDNTMIQRELGWEPSTCLAVGLRETYRWIEQEVKDAKDRPHPHG